MSDLRTLDSAIAAFVTESAAAYEAGETLARVDSVRLIAMAAGLITDARRWTREITALEISARRDLRTEDMVTLVVQTVFDECLSAEAMGVLIAAIPLAVTPED